MGCFQSKTKKNKAKPMKMPKVKMGQNNLRWKRFLQNSITSRLIIEDINGTAEHPAYKAIDKDVRRTFPNEQFFNKQSTMALFKLTLKCFALTFPKVGYTQGLNFFAGYLLLNELNKIQTLNILASTMAHPQLLCLGLYEDGFPLAHFYCELFWKILKKVDTELYDCLKLVGVPDHMWIFQWYLTFFLYSFPIEYISFYFNAIFDRKEFEMVLISVGIVVCMREEILGMSEKDDICLMELLQNLKVLETCMKIVNVEESIERAHLIERSFVDQGLEQIRRQQKVDNFYLKYFSSSEPKRKPLYTRFIGEVQLKREQLTNSKHDQMLMQSYRRSRETVEILDEILLQSMKRQMNKKYKSHMGESRRNRIDKNLGFRKWKSLANLEQDQENQKEGETTVSIVKKVVIIDQDKNE